MSNRKKPKRNKELRKQILRGSLGDDKRLDAIIGESKQVTMPDDEKELLKTVPAVIEDDQGNKVTIGVANIYDDRSVDYIVDEDAPQWAKDKISATEKEYAAWLKGGGVSLGPFAPPRED